MQTNDEILSINNTPTTWENIAELLSGTAEQEFIIKRKTDKNETKTANTICKNNPCLLGVYGQEKYSIATYDNTL
jgi:hypothetical protein